MKKKTRNILVISLVLLGMAAVVFGFFYFGQSPNPFDPENKEQHYILTAKSSVQLDKTPIIGGWKIWVPVETYSRPQGWFTIVPMSAWFQTGPITVKGSVVDLQGRGPVACSSDNLGGFDAIRGGVKDFEIYCRDLPAGDYVLSIGVYEGTSKVADTTVGVSLP